MNGYSNGSNSSHGRRRVAIIGAGPAGLAVTQKFLKYKHLFDVTVFEKQKDVGGQWIYTDNVGNDEYGFPVHSSIYRYLKTNLPLALMEFDDYPHNANPSRFVGHQYILKYLKDFADHFNMTKHIKFLHTVTYIKRSNNSWIVEYKNLETNETGTEYFDVIAICQGRFSSPLIPNDVPGLEQFKGQILHTHTYRAPEDFKNQRVAILGGGPSGLDVALEISGYAKSIFLCHKMEHGKPPLDDRITQIDAGFKSLSSNSIELSNGTCLENIDSIIFATGYNLDLDIVDPECGIHAGEGRIEGLFLHMINIQNPTMAIFGLLEKIPPFNFFSQMGKYFVGTLIGEAKLPSKEEMLADLEADRKERRSIGAKEKHAHRMFNDQMWRYDKKISSLGRFKPLPPLTKSLYDECFALRWREIDYKNYQFQLDENGETFTIVKKESIVNGNVDH